MESWKLHVIFYCFFICMLFHIIDFYIYSTRQNNNWIYKNHPIQKFTYPWILILCVISWMIQDCFYILWLLFMSPLLVLSSSVCCSSEKSSSFCTFFGFPASSAYLNPFQKWLYDYEIHIFTFEDNRGTHTQLLQKVETFEEFICKNR